MDVSAVENNAVENNATETNAAENDAAETSATENEDDTGWDVEKIEDEMYLDDGSSKYLIKWKMPGAADSWEPEKNLDPELIDEWEKSRPL
ncbi:hypothetical protein B0T26DRAFT_706586 [Lasiosphaeria miniovina]|uniref:Chromo domain-containing protein n=1 Tax=Lasiosphaeria miniovina TaxID=1954250 RepID=A0AA40AWW1_9PEZI|nr:uncharacterized protein B0T26DRAFT_706586 [Lasiosphaeria miniovina]KAK0723497.1 hypothetical protein B0T26DRAFT_706586 [Lasiosphaeria miniovina]